MRKLTLIFFLLLSGCSTLSITAPDGTTISHTRVFDDQEMGQVMIESQGFKGSMGSFRNNGQIDIQTLIKILQAAEVTP